MNNQIHIVMTGDEARAFRSMQNLIDQQAKLQSGLKNSKKDGEDAFGEKMISNLANFAAGIFGITKAVQAVQGAYKDWQDTIHKVAEAANQASKDIIAFAALQAGGTKAARVNEAMGVAQSYGVRERGVAFDVLQALQAGFQFGNKSLSDEGAWRQAISSAPEAFKLMQLGVSAPAAADTVIQAMAQKVDPGSFARKVYLAGEAGTRKPEDVAGAAKGMAFWTDKDFGAAAASVISGEQAKTGSEGETEVYLRQAGRALSGIGDLAKNRFWQKHGLKADATQEERLTLLAELGINTPEKLQAAGMGDVREIKGVQTLVTGIESLRNIRDHIVRNDRPGLLEQRRGTVEEEMPNMRASRELDILKTMYADTLAFPQDDKQLQQENLAKARAIALRRFGMVGSIFGGKFEDENERVGDVAWLRATYLPKDTLYAPADDYKAFFDRMREMGIEPRESPPAPEDVIRVLNTEVERILSSVAASSERMATAAESFNRTASGGPTLERVNEDR